ncbi:MAG: dodecin [Alphaproteobacteria bacterium]
MDDNVYAVTEVVGSSQTSVEDAIKNAVATASKTLRNVEWFEIGATRGHIVDGAVAHYQVYVRLGFRYEKD